MRSSDSNFQVPPGYVLVPRWALYAGFAALVLALTLGLFTFPGIAPNAAPPRVAQLAPTVSVAPRTLMSASRTLGDPNAPIQLVEFSDFQ